MCEKISSRFYLDALKDMLPINTVVASAVTFNCYGFLFCYLKVCLFSCFLPIDYYTVILLPAN